MWLQLGPQIKAVQLIHKIICTVSHTQDFEYIKRRSIFLRSITARRINIAFYSAIITVTVFAGNNSCSLGAVFSMLKLESLCQTRHESEFSNDSGDNIVCS